MKICTKCGVSKPLCDFGKHKITKDGLNYRCKPCNVVAVKQWAKENPLKAAEVGRQSRQKHPETKKLWRKNNPDKKALYAKRWRQANPDKCNANDAKRRAAKLQATPPWLTQDDFANIQQFYTIANQLTELNGQIYHVDHIIPLQGETVCGLHVPWNLQVLDGPENLAKHNKLILPIEMMWD